MPVGLGTMSVIKCLICQDNFPTIRRLIGHVKRIHKQSSKDYYDNFIKKDGEGFCKECSKPVSYSTFGVGYRTFCSNICKAFPA